MIETKDLKKLGFEHVTDGPLAGSWYHEKTDTRVGYTDESVTMTGLDGRVSHWTDVAIWMIGTLEGRAWEIQMGDDL